MERIKSFIVVFLMGLAGVVYLYFLVSFGYAAFLGLQAKYWPEVPGKIITLSIDKIGAGIEQFNYPGCHCVIPQYEYIHNGESLSSTIVDLNDELSKSSLVFAKAEHKGNCPLRCGRKLYEVSYVLNKYPVGTSVKVKMNPLNKKMTILEYDDIMSAFYLFFLIVLICLPVGLRYRLNRYYW